MRVLPPRFAGPMAAAVLLGQALSGAEVQIVPADSPPALAPLTTRFGGRVVEVAGADGARVFRHQWPGVYFEGAFRGAGVFFKVGPGDVIYRVSVDGQSLAPLVKPGVGVYRVSGLSDGAHTVRVEAISESQSAPVDFGGLWIDAQTRSKNLPKVSRQIEFIGDSHTVGYANTSAKHACATDEVWRTTDTSQSYAPLTAQHFGAAYQVNAISGRGIVRNYNGFDAPTLPQAYPYALFDQRTKAGLRGWRPQVIVINLGTNDFSTPLRAEEKWKSRAELHADYEQTYVAFVQRLRRQHPQAFIILAANDLAEGETQQEVLKVLAQLQSAGEKRVHYLALPKLELTACDWHPSLQDNRLMSSVLISLIETQLGAKW